MALAETARLVARLDLGGNFLSQVGKVNKSVTGLDRLVAKSGDRWYKAGTQIGTGILRGAAIAAGGIGLITTQVALGLRSLAELEVLTSQTEAVLKSTGGVAGITAGKVAELSKKYEALGGVIDDKVIQNSENLLLTFTNVRKDGFEPALKAILNMNTALGGGEEGLQKNTILVGKALQDPIRGLTALRRVGVNFTKDQEKMIKALVESGDVMGAQKVIIAELDREFGGSFLAKGDTTVGKIGRFKESIESLQEALAKALLPTIGKVADKLAAFLSQPGTVRAIEDLGGKIASLFSDENIAKGAGLLRDAFSTVQSVLPGLKDAAEISGRVLSTAVGLFKSLPAPLQNAAIIALTANKLTGGLISNVAGGLLEFGLKNLRTITAANVTVIGANVTGGGLPGALPGGGKGKGGIPGPLKAILPLAVIAAAVEAGVALSGINDPRHQFRNPDGTTRTVRATNDASEQIANLIKSLDPLRQRAAGGDKDAARKLTAIETEIKRLQGVLATSTDRIVKAGGLSPDERQVANDQRTATNRIYDSLERNRLAKQAINVTVNVSTKVTVRDYVRAAIISTKYGRVAL